MAKEGRGERMFFEVNTVDSRNTDRGSSINFRGIMRKDDTLKML